MNDTDKATERRGLLQFVGVALAAVLIFNIGQHTTDDMKLLLLGVAAVLLGIPLGCITWPPSEKGRHFTPLRAVVAGLASVAAVVITSVIGYFFPEQWYVSPVIICLALIMIMHWQAP